MGSDDQITIWINRLRIGDAAAPEELWKAYFGRLLRLAHSQLNGLPRRAFDEEDIALSALDSFFRGERAGRFPRLADRHDLWNVLFTITAAKAARQKRRDLAKRRGGGKANSEVDDALDLALSREPSPALAAELAETSRNLLEMLDDDALRQIALGKLAGYSNAELAEQVGCGLRTIERKLERIRRKWQDVPVP